MRTAGDTLTTLLSRLAAGLMASIHDEPVTLATACLRQQPTLQDSSGWLFAPHTLLRRGDMVGIRWLHPVICR
jgi:hypothetical protein